MDLSGIGMNEILHAQRTAQLRRVPKGAGVFLSAGCAGSWYFDWIEDAYDKVDHHIGLEFYSPEPESLPANVTWIANTVGNMEAVGQDAVDLVFSGQNIEHLWPDDVAGFLLESNRVLRHGGRIVIDSPNRTVTSALNWSHPEHTVELVPSEAVELAELAGFEVDTMVGLWRCVDDGHFLPQPPSDELDLVLRTIGGLDAAEDAFVWWLEGVKVGRPDSGQLRARINEIFEPAWQERLQRLIPLVGDLSADGTMITSRENTEGVVFFGPYTPLPAGKHRIGFEVTSHHDIAESPGWCDVMTDSDPFALEHLPPMRAGETVCVDLDIELAELTFGVQYRLISRGTAQLSSPMRVVIETDSPVWPPAG